MLFFNFMCIFLVAGFHPQVQKFLNYMGIVDRFLQSLGQVILYYLCALSDGAVVGSNVPNLRPKNICAGDIPISGIAVVR